MRPGVNSIDPDKQLSVVQFEFESRIPYSRINRGRLVERKFMFAGQPCDCAIKRPAIDVGKAKSSRETTRDRAFSRSRRPIDRNNRELRTGAQCLSKMSAGLITCVGDFPPGVKKPSNFSSKPGYEFSTQSVSS